MLRELAKTFLVLTLAAFVVVGFASSGLLAGVALQVIRPEDFLAPLQKVASTGNSIFYGPGAAGVAALIRSALPRIIHGVSAWFDGLILARLDKITAPPGGKA